jgi:hypothetical protein
MKVLKFIDGITDGRKTLGMAGGALVLLFILGYALFAAYPYLRGPTLTLTYTQKDGLTNLYGETERVSYLTINGAEVPVGEDGNFSIERAYPKGYTAVTAVGRDRFGRLITKTLSFVTALATSTSYAQ